MDGDTKVTAALISATVSLIVGIVTAIVTARIARWQVQSKLDELTQTQFKDLVAKRIEVYPRLWDIAQTFTSGILIAANRGTAQIQWRNDIVYRGPRHLRRGVRLPPRVT